MVKQTYIGNKINEGKYSVSRKEKETELYRGVKEKEKTFLHFMYHTYNQKGNFEPITFKVGKLKELIDINTKDDKYIRDFISGCGGLTTHFTEDKTTLVYPIFSKFGYNSVAGTIEVKFNEELADYLYNSNDIELISKSSKYKKKKLTLTTTEAQEIKPKHKGGYTLTSHLEHSLLSSKYAMDLYEKLSQWKKARKKEYTFSELRDLLYIPKSYRPLHIKTKILEVSKQQINDNTSLKIDYEIEGKGRNQKVVFSIKSNKEKVQSKQNQGEDTKVEKSEVLKIDIKEPVQTELNDFKEEVKKIAKKQLDTLKYFEFGSKLVVANTFDLVNELVMEYTLNKTLDGME